MTSVGTRTVGNRLERSEYSVARIMAAAGPGEVIVSDLTRGLAGASGLRFDDRGTHTLKGLEGEWRLAAYVPEA